MNKRQKKKLENRAGFFHYRDYKLRVKILYDIFGPVVNNDGPYAFKQYMFNYAKTVLFTKAPTKIFNRKYRRYGMPELENCVVSSFGRYADIVKPDVIPSMSMRMVGDKIHSFSIDEDSFKNGYKPDELAVPLPKGPLDGHKSMTSAKLSAIREMPEMVSAKLTIEHGDTDRMRRQIMSDDHILGGQAIEYPSSATIDLRKVVGRYGNMSIKGADKDISEPIHLGPIDLGPTDGERIEEHLDDLIDRRKRFAGNSCEAMGMEVD